MKLLATITLCAVIFSSVFCAKAYWNIEDINMRILAETQKKNELLIKAIKEKRVVVQQFGEHFEIEGIEGADTFVVPKDFK